MSPQRPLGPEKRLLALFTALVVAYWGILFTFAQVFGHVTHS